MYERFSRKPENSLTLAMKKSIQERLDILGRTVHSLTNEIKSPAEETIMDCLLLMLNEISLLHQRIDGKL